MKVCHVCKAINEENASYCLSCLQPLNVENIDNKTTLIKKEILPNYSNIAEKSTLLLLFLYLIEFIFVAFLVDFASSLLQSILKTIFDENTFLFSILSYVTLLLEHISTLFLLLNKKVPRDKNIFSNTLFILISLWYGFIYGLQLYLSDVPFIGFEQYIHYFIKAILLGNIVANIANLFMKKKGCKTDTNKSMIITNIITLLLLCIVFGIGLYGKRNGIVISGYYS